MYTKTIIVLGIIAILIQCIRWKQTDKKILSSWLFICCSLSWIEFPAFNFADPLMAAWEFSEEHITGIYILGMTIEDFFFAPIFGILFLNLYDIVDRKINYTSKNLSKVFVLSFHVLILIFFSVFGGEFGKYQAIRMCIGLLLIAFYSWNSWDLRQFWIMMIGIFFIAGLWDIWANSIANIQHWFYRDIETLKHSKVYATWPFWWFKIGKGWFPLSIMPYYYVSSACFTVGILDSLYKLFKLKTKGYS